MLFGRTSDVEYIALLLKAGDNMLEAAHVFRSAMMGEAPPASYTDQLGELERKGDDYTQQLLAGLSGVQTAPVQKELLLELALRIDDVTDGIEASIARFDYLGIQSTDRVMQQFSGLIVSCCTHLVDSLKLLAAKKYLHIREHTVAINRLENEADVLMREGIRAIFKAPKDPYHDFKLKELYERLEETTDRCEDAADVMQAVILKYSV